MLEFESSQVSQPLVQLKIAHTFVTKSSQNAGFLTFIGLSPGSGKAQLQRKVSGHVRQYSHFRETFGGDLFRSVLIGRGDSYFEDFWRRLLIAPDKTDQGEITIGARRSFGDCLAVYLRGCDDGKTHKQCCEDTRGPMSHVATEIVSRIRVQYPAAGFRKREGCKEEYAVGRHRKDRDGVGE